jgi:hypothetical protein
MKTTLVAVFTIFCVFFLSCSKKDKVELVSGTVNGVAAITLYGTSNKPADYIFLSSDSTQKEMSYNGVLLTYVKTGATSTGIFILLNHIAAAKADLGLVGSKTVLTIDSTYGINFTSREYMSY